MHLNELKLPDSAVVQIAALRDALNAALDGQLAALYLHGSAVMGCFCPSSSDIDLIGVCRGHMAGEAQARVARAVLELEGKPHTIEMSILSEDALHPWHHPAPYEFHFSQMHAEHFRDMLARGEVNASGGGDADLAAHLSVCRARGVALIGPEASDMFEPVPYADYYFSAADDFDWLREDDVPAVYAVLNACRVLRLAREEGVYSKREGGLWALKQPEVPCKALIQRALDAYACGGSMERGDELNELLDWAGQEIAQRRAALSAAQ